MLTACDACHCRLKMLAELKLNLAQGLYWLLVDSQKWWTKLQVAWKHIK